MRRSMILTACLVLGFASCSAAQQVKVSTPFHQLNDSFYENFNIGWGIDKRNANGGGWFFTGPGAAPPPFGRHDPNTDGRFGIGNGSGFFNFTFGQGSNRSMSSQTPSVVVPNGYGGSISDTTLRPFVTGFTPVVGGLPVSAPPTITSPLGASREQIYQNVQRIQEQMAIKQLQTAKDDKEREAVALAAERKRLRERARTGVSGDDPPLRLGGQQ